MPYSNPKQATAIFLDLKRKQGLKAAKMFAEKHKADMRRGSSNSNLSYKPRSKRGD